MDDDSQSHLPSVPVPPGDETAVTFPPSTGRLIRVASGLQSWTEAELEWLKQNPRWMKYEQNMRETFQQKNKALGSDQAFSKQVDESRKGKPPSI